MAEKENDKKASRMRRKLSKKHVEKEPTSIPETSAAGNPKSATLPLANDHGSQALNSSHSEGLFSKLKKRFRFGSKGKYDFKSYNLNSPSKPRWLRRKSDETQLQADKSDLRVERDEGNPIGKSSSVKTSRKAKPYKEEVILIRKDKRVSVVCKAENGAPEVIFSNVDHSDEDSSGTWAGIEEDPYATISSVHDEVNKKKLNKSSTLGREKESPSDTSVLKKMPMVGPDQSSVNSEECPYARIDLSKKRKTTSEPLTQAQGFNTLMAQQARFHNEPDYETLDDVKEKKGLLQQATKDIPSLTCNEHASCSDTTCTTHFDPDYETLEEVKQRCATASVPSSPVVHLPEPDAVQQSRNSSGESSNTTPRNSDDQTETGRLSIATYPREEKSRYSWVMPFSLSQGSRSPSAGSPQQSIFRSSLTPSPVSPTALAPLAPSDDSTLPHDKPPRQTPSPVDGECLYDNPNVILRKQVLRTGGGSGSSTFSRKGHVLSEPPTIKTPAEEELVEKLSALLAPPLPLRNYQKDEVHPYKGERIIRSCGGTARHSWSSQTTKNMDNFEPAMPKENEKGQSLSVGHSSENLPLKTVKDSFLTKVHERQDKKLVPERYNKVFHIHCKSEGSVNEAELESTATNQRCNKLTINESGGKEHECSSSRKINLEDNSIEDFGQHLAAKIVQEAVVSVTSTMASKNGVVDKVILDVPSTNTCTSMIGETKPSVNVSSMERKRQRNNAAEDRIHSPSLSLAEEVENFNKFREKKSSMDIKDRPSVSCHSQSVDDATNVEKYKLQGARPKCKPLRLKSTNSAPLKLNEDKGRDSAANQTCAQSQQFASSSQANITDSRTIDEDATSPSFTDVDFHEDVQENIPRSDYSTYFDRVKERSKTVLGKKNKKDPENVIQETVYFDSDSEEKEVGQAIYSSFVVHVQADLSIKRIVKPVLYANPRLLENVINGKFKREDSLDELYLQNGIFKWARYFPYLADDRQQIEKKLKGFFWYMNDMLIVSSPTVEKRRPGVRKLQREMDYWQTRIEKRLEDVHLLPTFTAVQLKLLKTCQIDRWEPEEPRLDKFTTDSYRWSDADAEDKCSTKKSNRQYLRGKNSDDSSKEARPIQDLLFTVHSSLESWEDLHSYETFSDDSSEGFCDAGGNKSSQSSPANPSQILGEFLRLSEYPVKCSHCDDEEESDSEDEMIALKTYAKTVSGPCPREHFGKTEHVNTVSLCRALHGELAYSARVRKPRPDRKMLSVPGLDRDCRGPKSHFSWKEWVTADSLFKKLVSHISPRLDFQFLLKTYAEFKHFILKDRKKSEEHRGCYLITTYPDPPHGWRCCRFEEFVFLRLIAEELRHIAKVIRMSENSKALFIEEWEVAFSLLKLMKLTLRNIHKMRKSVTTVPVHGQKPTENDISEYKVVFRHGHLVPRQRDEWPFLDPKDRVFRRRFHVENYTNFRNNSISTTLMNWKSPQDYLEDPNVLATCRTVFAHTNSRSLELAGMKGPEGDPKPLQEREDFLESLEQLQMKEWYWGPISYEQAALILKDKEDGSFLVRDSSDQKYLLSLSFKSLGEVHHTRIEHAKGLFSFWSQPESHGKAKICEFIEKSIQNSRDGRFLYFLRPSGRGNPPLPIRLLNPVSRNFRVATLKHLSRFVVRQYVRKDHLDHLPVPGKVKRYLKDKQYYAEILDEDEWGFESD